MKGSYRLVTSRCCCRTPVGEYRPKRWNACAKRHSHPSSVILGQWSRESSRNNSSLDERERDDGRFLEHGILTSGRSDNAGVLIDGFEKLSDDQWDTLDTFDLFLGMKHLLLQILQLCFDIFFLHFEKFQLPLKFLKERNTRRSSRRSLAAANLVFRVEIITVQGFVLRRQDVVLMKCPSEFILKESPIVSRVMIQHADAPLSAGKRELLLLLLQPCRGGNRI